MLNTYIHRDVETPEDNIESPFAQLELIEIDSKKNGELNYKKNIHKNLNVHLAYYILENQANGKETLDIKDIVYSKNGIGNIFNLELYDIMAILDQLKNLEYINIVRTGGLDYINFVNKIEEQEILNKLYIS